MRRLRTLMLVALPAGCAVPPPPPSPEPVAAGDRRAGVVAAAPSETAFCVSRQVPGSQVRFLTDGLAVRPAAAVVPDYALVLRPGRDGLAWSRTVAPAEPAAVASRAVGLDAALAACIPPGARR